MLLGPGPHLPLEKSLASLNLDRDRVRVYFRAPQEGLFNLPLQLRWCGQWLDSDEISDTLHTPELADHSLGFLLLILPLHVPLQRDPSLRDSDTDLPRRDVSVPLQ